MDGQWAYRGVIATDFAEYPLSCRLTGKNGVSAFVAGIDNTHLLERPASGWLATKVTTGSVNEIAVQGRTIALASKRGSTSIVRLFEKNASGVWANNLTLDGPAFTDDSDFLGPDIEFAPNSI